VISNFDLSVSLEINFYTLETSKSTMVGEDFGLFSPFAAEKALTAVSEKCSRCDTRSCSHKTSSVTQTPICKRALCKIS
jgi:hypothetical protein